MIVALSWGMGFSSAAPRLERVTIAQGANALSFLPMYVGRHNYYWAEEGLDVDLVFTRGAGECLTAVLSRDVVACATASFPMIQAYTRGQTALISVGNIINRFTLNGALRKGFLKERKINEQAFLAASVVNRVKQMRGSRMGATGPGSATDIFTRWLVRRAGMDPDRDVTIVTLGSAEGLYAALRANRIDSFLVSPPLSVQPVVEGIAVTYLDSLKGELPGMDDFVYEILVVHRDLIRDNPEMVRRLVNGLKKSNNFIVKNASDARVLTRVSKAFFPQVDDKVLELSAVGVAPAIPLDALQSERGWRNVLAFMEEGGLIKSGELKPDEGQFWTNQFAKR